MRRIILLMLLLAASTNKVQAAEFAFTAPQVPSVGEEIMIEPTNDFLQDLLNILNKALPHVQPALSEAAKICLRVLGVVILLSILHMFVPIDHGVIQITGTISLSILLLSASKAMIPLGVDTIQELSNYNKLLLPVMTTALAAQGSATTSSALYMGTAFFDSILSSSINSFLVPGIYVFLALTIAANSLDEPMIQKFKESVKSAITWFLKIALLVFTGYMTISGAVSGSTDAMAMKATKITISSAVPAIGGILADASEAVLVSASLMKNTAGIYGIFAVLAIVIGPFLRIGTQYILLKLTSTICSSIGPKNMASLISDFAAALGLILAMTAAVSVMVLISVVCFMRVVS